MAYSTAATDATAIQPLVKAAMIKAAINTISADKTTPNADQRIPRFSIALLQNPDVWAPVVSFANVALNARASGVTDVQLDTDMGGLIPILAVGH